ncbi:MAG: hypothetical protein KTR28_04000 [Micavibrio sp.]|nr:hypothetical protein [Micavibrio sp.]
MRYIFTFLCMILSAPFGKCEGFNYLFPRIALWNEDFKRLDGLMQAFMSFIVAFKMDRVNLDHVLFLGSSLHCAPSNEM